MAHARETDERMDGQMEDKNKNVDTRSYAEGI